MHKVWNTNKAQLPQIYWWLFAQTCELQITYVATINLVTIVCAIILVNEDTLDCVCKSQKAILLGTGRTGARTDIDAAACITT